ncbi:MAG: acetolactate synthase large subunit, partial [Paludibacteraceae bacterium]|nr:acetolactate synthase large subunit [Paludibacteraceae bacterium]
MSNQMKGAYILMESLLKENVDTIFGYPGGSIMPTFDALYDYMDKFNYVLTRHEQGATHAAQGYARVSGKTGVCLVTSGPGATNAITGIADAMMDSTPLVVIAGQAGAAFLGTDAFQEVDLIGCTLPITKWSYQIRSAADIAPAVAKAFHIANSGRKGPVVLDFAKNAQVEMAEFNYEKCHFTRGYIPFTAIKPTQIDAAAEIINNAKKPLALVGQGVILGNAEAELKAFLEKADIPAGSTLLGLSALPSDHRLNKGMLGMHGNVGPNIKTNEADVIIAIGMRFDDRVTGDLKTYAKQAKIVHLDIDNAELDKNVKATAKVLGDVKASLPELTLKIKEAKHTQWIESFHEYEVKEDEKVIRPEVYATEGPLKMGEVVRKISEATNNDAVLVTDVGQ